MPPTEKIEKTLEVVYTSSINFAKEAYHLRNLLYKDFIVKQASPSNSLQVMPSYFHFVKGQHHASDRLSLSENYKLIQSAVCTLSMAGDSPTTDRIFTAIETSTIILVLDSEMEMLIKKLPKFPMVNWKRLLVPVKLEVFKKRPIHSLIDTCRAITNGQMEEFQEQMLQTQRQLSFVTDNNSVVFQNFMTEAYFVANPVNSELLLHKDAVCKVNCSRLQK